MNSDFNGDKFVVVYGGRFQPPTLGHYSIYKMVKKLFPLNDVWISTSDKTDRLTNNGLKSPFNFNDKKLLWEGLFGVKDVIQCKNPVVDPVEIMNMYGPDYKLIMIVGMEDNNRYKSIPDWKSWEDKSIMDHNYTNYYLSLPMVDRTVYKATHYRNILKSNDINKFIELYGNVDKSLFELIQKRLNGVYDN